MVAGVKVVGKNKNKPFAGFIQFLNGDKAPRRGFGMGKEKIKT